MHRTGDRILPAEWTLWLWTDEDNRRLVSRELPEFLSFYDRLDAHIKRVDVVRFFYLFVYGGVCMKPAVSHARCDGTCDL